MAGIELIGGAVGSLLGAGFNSAASKRAADTAYSRQKELMALQNQYAVENWSREVNYNDPKQQMNRLKDAGLNPHLVYGSGSVGLESPGIAAPSAPSAPMQASAPGNFGAAVSDAVNAAVGIAQAKKAGVETIGQNIENEYALKTLNDRIDQIAIDNNWKKADIARIKETTAQIMEQKNLITGQIDLMLTEKSLKQQEIENLKKQGILVEKQGSLMDKEINWFAACRRADIAQKLASAGYNNAMAHQVESMLPLLMTSQKLANGLSAVQFGLQEKYGEAQIWVDMISKGVGTLGDFIGNIIPIKHVTNVFKTVKSYITNNNN